MSLKIGLGVSICFRVLRLHKSINVSNNPDIKARANVLHMVGSMDGYVIQKITNSFLEKQYRQAAPFDKFLGPTKN